MLPFAALRRPWRRFPMLCLSLALALTMPLALAGCAEDDSPPGTGSLGEEDDPCKRSSDCRISLVCAANATCQRPSEPGTGGEGEGCGSNDDCQIELVCSAENKCAKPGTGGEGSPCQGNDSCQKGLLCSAGGTCARPGTPGTKVVGEACAAEGECALGLLCLLGKCQQLTFWGGAECTSDDGKLRPYFEIPRGGKALADFYRLPFPNDIRMTAEGTVDVTQHPDPGVVLPEPYTKVVSSYYQQIKKDVTGFGVSTAIYFRFSKEIDFATLSLSGASPTVQFVDITKTSPGYAKGVGLLLGASTGRGKYICENNMNVRPTPGRPLRAKTTYAVLLRSGIKAADGTPASADTDLTIVLGDAKPTDADELAAWTAYQPLRDYLKDQNIDASSVIGATVFTTMDPREHMARFGAVMAKEATDHPPQLEQLTLCEGAATSPCADPKEPSRACPASADAAFHELHGMVETPVFQQGTPPYKTPADGGDIAYDGTGAPVVNRREKTCVGLSIPKKAQMPAAGWPVVIFAAGTGGSFRSFVNNGTAAALAEVKDKTGAALGSFAVISVDPALHGPRRGSDDDPDQLFFNLLNPKSARDNVYQGAMDKSRLVQLIKSLNLDVATSPTGAAVKFDTSKIYYFGHSQGSIEGLPFVAFDGDVKGTVMSGAGGYLIGSLLAKKKPFDIAALTQLALAEPKAVTSTHPLLNVLQLYFEEVDSLNYGRAIADTPPQSVAPKHYFLSYGAEDSYTPPGTIEVLARASSLPQVVRCGDGVCTGTEDCNSCAADCPSGADCAKVDKTFGALELPVSGNFSKSTGGNVTAAMARFKGDGSFDDHFVLFQLPEAKSQVSRFLGSAAAASDGIPTID